jgi:hypothetical protein
VKRRYRSSISWGIKMRASRQVEQEMNRPEKKRLVARSKRTRIVPHPKPQRKSTGARAEHDRRVAERRGESPKVRGMLGRIGPGIKRDSDYGAAEVRKKMENRRKR